MNNVPTPAPMAVPTPTTATTDAKTGASGAAPIAPATKPIVPAAPTVPPYTRCFSVIRITNFYIFLKFQSLY